MDDYRPVLDQLAKLKFNRVFLVIYPWQPFLHLEVDGVAQRSAYLWFDMHFPITDELGLNGSAEASADANANAAELGPAWKNVFIRTLRLSFFNRPGTRYCTPTSVIVYFDREFRYQDNLVPMIDRINAEQHRIPWMDDRLLVLSVCPDGKPRAGP